MEKYTADRLVTINVDVQNDFCPGGALAVTDGDAVIPPLNELNEFTRLHGGTVVFTGDQHPEETPHFEKWPRHCITGTEGAALHDDLVVKAEDRMLAKGTDQEDGYSGFEGTLENGDRLETLLTPVDRERVAVLVGGLATDYCVLNTVLDGVRVAKKQGDIRVFALKDAMRAVNLNPEDGEKALADMRAAGAIIVDTEDILTQRALELAQ